MQVNLLKGIVSSIAGQPAAGIVDLLYDKKNVNEFLIAKKLKLTINQTRNILYKLADEGIVSFVRKKDRKKGGWYIYFWTLSSGKGLLKLKEHLTNEIDKLKVKLESKKTQRFFNCKNCNIEVTEESALASNYTCTECGEVLQLSERGKEVDAIEKEIAKVEAILAGVDKELEIINKGEEVKKTRRIKAEEKKKVKERALRKRVREKEKAKVVRAKKKKVKERALRKKARNTKKKAKRKSSLGRKLQKLFR